MSNLLKSFANRFSAKPAEPEIVVDISRAIRKPADRPAVVDAGPDPASPSGVRPTTQSSSASDTRLVELEDMGDRAEAAAQGMTANYRAWLDSDLRRLSDTWKAWQTHASPDKAIVQKFYMAAHDLKGVARTYEYPMIADLCASICKLVPRLDTDANRQLITLHVDTCWAAFREGGDVSEKSQQVFDALQTMVETSPD